MKAAIYTRVSTSEQAEEGFSLEAQHDTLMQVLERKEMQLYRVYSDPGISGKTMKKRPGIQALMTDMKAGKFEALLIHKLDRLSRNLGDLYAFVELINKLNVRLIIAAQGPEEIDTRSPMGKAFLFFSGIWAQIYLDNLREETLKGLTKKMQKGGKHISNPPLGYTFDEGYNLVVQEDEAELVREVFDLFGNKMWGVTKIAKHMNTHSTTKKGGRWDNKTVRLIVTNPTYAGYHHFKPVEWAEDRRIMTDGQHEPLVSRELFEKIQSMRARRKQGHLSRRAFEYPFGGIVKCGRCGATYTGNAATHKDSVYRSYRCLNQYAKSTCDAPGISERMLTELLFNHVLIRFDDVQEAKQTKERKKVIRNMQKEVEISNRRRKNWMLALGDGKLSPADYAMLIDEEEARMKSIYEEIQEEDARQSEISPEQLREMIGSLRDNWDLLNVDTQKELIQNMFRKIVVHKEKDDWEIVDLLTV